MKKILYGVLAFSPVLAFAASDTSLTPLVSIITALSKILGLLIPMAFGLAILYFFYGVAKYVGSAGDPKAADAGKSIMIYGVIAIAVMASLWGLVTWLQGTLGITNNTQPSQTITLPKVN